MKSIFSLSFILSIIVLLSVSATVLAADTVKNTTKGSIKETVKESAKEVVWVTPKNAAIDAAISINATVKNPSTQRITATVVFTAGKTLLGKTTIVVAKKSSGTATLRWNMPTVSTEVQAEVVSAVTSDDKFIASATGVLGTVAVTPPNDESAISAAVKNFDISKIPGITVALQKTEPFRIAQAKKFSASAKEIRTRISDEVSKKVAKKVGDTVSNALSPEGTAKQKGATTTEVLDNSNPFDNTADYGNLIVAMSLAAFFGNMLFFYISIILVALIIIRKLLSLFARKPAVQ